MMINMSITKSTSIGDVLIVGAGAIGGVIGAFLHKAHIDVCLINREGSHYRKIKSDGLVIEGYNKSFNIPIKKSFSELDRSYKHVLVAVKNLETNDAIKGVSKILTPKSLVYSLQNGFGNTDIIAKYLPHNNIVAGVVGWGATKVEPGKIRITSKSGNFVLGFETGLHCEDVRLKDIKKKLCYWKPTILTNNIIGYRWAKLLVNSVIAPFGGLFGLSVGDLFKNPRIRKIMSALKEEGIRVADALNIKLEKVDNINIRNFFYKPKIDDNLFTQIKSRLMSNLIAKIGIKRHGKIKSSMLWDLEQKRLTEIDFLNGYICKKGKEVDVETPINSFLVKAIHEIEKGKRKITLENIQELEEVAKSK